jgi:6-phospho-beta-glucosidase
VTCQVGASGATPRPVAPVGPALSGLIAAVAAYEELAVAAAVHGGRSRVYSALLAHPLVAQHERAEALAGEVLA